MCSFFNFDVDYPASKISEMKSLLLISLSILLFCSSLAAQVPDSLKYISFNPALFKNAMDTAGNVMVIDVREYFEFRKIRIKGAVNLPASGSLKVPADTIAKAMSLFLYCTSGFRSKRVAKGFYEEGFRRLYSLDGGINGWKKQGLPVDKKRIRKK
jgi:rhodanese-related sulfurtransferase